MCFKFADVKFKVYLPATRCQRRMSISALNTRRIVRDFGGAWSHPAKLSRLRSTINATCQTDLPQRSCQARKFLNGDRKTSRILTRRMVGKTGAG
jgi:hypothetical protein